ncbi:MAG: serine/threonine protein kinase [Gemmatimonadetes bacterium]|nr:serine/threonine protein kinase [Gemmatimonadota bacterium]
MTSPAARHARAMALFHRALELPADQREAMLHTWAGDDPEVVSRVRAMLVADAADGDLLGVGIGAMAADLLAAPAAPADGAFGPYRIVRQLGEGGMGIVYLVARDDLGTEAALKILRDAWLSPARRARFRREQRTLARLVHPGIAQLHDAGALEDGTPWFVMEYVEGEHLTDYCERRQLTITERLRLLRAACEAVQYAHARAVIHRDLKPSNILVGADGRVALLDFGIAKHLEDTEDPVQTQTGAGMLTPAYAAPEQLAEGIVSAQTDVHALGVILYELLAGQRPFGGSDAVARRLTEPPVRPSLAAARHGRRTGNDATWRDLDILTLTAIQRDPALRYGTVEAFARDIDHFLAGEPLEAHPARWRYRTGKLLRRRWREVTAATTVVIAAIGLVTYYTMRLADARDAAQLEARRAERIQRFTMGLFSGGGDDAGPADSLSVRGLLERGEQEAAVLDRDPEGQAELYATLGTIHQHLGDYDRADSLLTRSLARQRALHGPVHRDVAAGLVALGLLRVDQAQLAPAESLVRAGLTMARTTYPAGDPAIVEAMAALGAVLQERGEYPAARAIQDSVLLARRTADPLLRATAMVHLAATYFYAGEYARADSLHREALPLLLATRGPRHPSVAEIHTNLGASAFQRGDYALSEQEQRQALDIIRAWYGTDNPTTASAITQVGRAVSRLDRPDEARALLSEALAIQQRTAGPNHPRVASALNELASLDLAAKHFDEAEASYQRVRAIYQQVHGPDDWRTGIAISNLGAVANGRENYRAAEALFREAKRIFTASQGGTHVNTAIARLKLGRSMLRQKRYAEALDETKAGFDILVTQAEPSVSYLKAARTDMAAEYEALGRKGEAERVRADTVGKE